MLCIFTAPPKFSKEMSDKLELKAGSSAVIEVPFTGNPQPTVTWTYNKGKLPDAKRFKVDTIINMTSVSMAKVIRNDKGDFNVTLKNEVGEASYTVHVSILGMTKNLCIDYNVKNFAWVAQNVHIAN